MAKRQTRADLEAALKAEQDTTAALREKVRGLQGVVQEHDRQHTELRSRIDDLKTRLAQAEATTNEMRGYIARVQEDDVVREELVQTGDLAGGEVRLEPKRKPHHFPSPGERDRTMNAFMVDRHAYADTPEGRRRSRGHYVTY